MKIQIELQPAALIASAAAMLILPLDLLFAALAAAAFHEAGHLLALRCFRVYQCRLRIGRTGAQIITGAMKPTQEILCAAAGPAASFCLAGLWSVLPLLALCAGIQGLFNLLPICQLDGGRILRLILEYLIPEYAEISMKVIGLAISGVFAVAAIRMMNTWIPIIIFSVLLLKLLPEKYLAKMRRNRYNGTE